MNACYNEGLTQIVTPFKSVLKVIQSFSQVTVHFFTADWTGQNLFIQYVLMFNPEQNLLMCLDMLCSSALDKMEKGPGNPKAKVNPKASWLTH